MSSKDPKKRPAGQPIPSTLYVGLVDASGHHHPVLKTPLVIGRRNAELVFADPTISTRHALIEHTAQGFVIIDQGSTNGTFVNGARVTIAPLAHQDEIRLGDAKYTFSVTDGPAAAAEDTAATTTGRTLLIGNPPAPEPLPLTQNVILHCETGGLMHKARLALRVTTVGRADADVNIDDPSLSLHHFQVEVHPNHLAIKDLASANGTLVDNLPVSYAVVQPGQVFAAGHTRFHLETSEIS